MIKNYLKIAFRNLRNQKGYAFINISGLAVGLACCILIMIYVTHELSYDKHHEYSDRIYRVVSKIDFSGNYLELATAPAPMGPTLKQDFPEVEAVTRFRPIGSRIVKRGDMNIKEDGLVLADPSVFRVFTIPMQYGDPETALEKPNTVVITDKIAQKYFGKLDAVGERIIILDEFEFEVTGVIEEMPSTSHFHFNFMLSMSTTEEAENNSWFSNNFRTYVLLKPGVDAERFEENFETIKKQYVEPQLKSFMGISLDEFEAAGNSAEYALQPLTSIHLYSDLTGEFEPNGSITYVYIFSGLAVFVLLLACINFMNLATARSSVRAREVGIRKTLGSARSQLTVQFLSETVLLSILAMFVALFLVELSLPYFSNLSGTDIRSGYLNEPTIMAGLFAVVLITGLFAGSYPAVMLSSLKPSRVLKGVFSEQWRHIFMRKGLVVFQFSISIVIIVGLLVINKQLNFIQSKELGFSKDQIIIVEDAYTLGSSYAVDALKEEMLKDPIFKSATISSFFPVQGYSKNDLVHWPKGEEPTQNNTVSMQTWTVDEDYIPTLGMELVAGRNFDEERGTEEQTVILNESAVKRFKFEDPVGESIVSYGFDHNGNIDNSQVREYRIIGVVKDFHYESLRRNIEPLGLFYGKSSGNVAFAIGASNSREAIEKLEAWWNEKAPDRPFNYSFMDQQFEQMYRSEQRVQNLMTAFSLIALFIACLGLFGLSAHSVNRRTKEIGIRKVMGATVPNVLALISGEFLKLVVISFLISIPISYFAATRWLNDFTYRTNIGVDIFLLTGLGAILIALLTVSGQSVKAALMNPADSLRSE
ncbi:FtsX-like permease family protein [Balneolaceae bacterium YR4-1]|uniref:FtsX-like permease family protein n=1 Tax=Halalkalibaculum roseum TaxID=2709311 RepID=A0A6M1T6V6_9BACT|nr:ABC transporter permease [Halalkalibaculum roseum]NGP77685.1 FtsX-like permease family protein [Halalkalibaculum roseum]